jgi:hypothetical protein
MRFIAMMRTAESHGFPPPELHHGMAVLGAEARAAGVLLDTAGLLPAATATRVCVAGGELTLSDGPSDEPLPLGAYAVYDVTDGAEAVQWTRRFMDLHRRTWPGWAGESEIRRVVGPNG